MLYIHTLSFYNIEYLDVADHCLNVPCEHGVCVQVKRYGHRTWECECTSSGFYGHRCQHGMHRVSD